MTEYTDVLPDLLPLREISKNVYVDPPLFSDAANARSDETRKIVIDLNLLSSKSRWLKVLGKGLHKFRTGIEKNNVYLKNLPKGYLFRQDKKRNNYITGHPGGHSLTAVKFLPHLLWLESASTQQECTCLGCTLPAIPIPRPSGRIISGLSRQINDCTIDSFKRMTKVTIESPHGFYPKIFIIPLPKTIKPDMILLSEKQERLLATPVENQ